MNSVPRQLATFGAVLAVLFAGGVLAGQLIDPDTSGDAGGAHAAEGGHGEMTSSPEGDHAPAPAAEGGHGEMTSSPEGDHAPAPAAEVRGLAVADGGLRVEVVDPELRRGRRRSLGFRILDADGQAVRDYDVTHERRMHLIVVRRDLGGFQHLHPVLGADGTWTAPVTLDEAGSYRLFADFSHGGRAVTLASDLRVDGAADLRPLPAARSEAVSDGGYDVRLDAGAPRSARESELRFSIARDGEPVQTEPYLGAGGHLVALREGDLAFLHVHPTEHRKGAVGFAATFPTEGRYRLFLQFKHEGRVQTVAFTQEVGR